MKIYPADALQKFELQFIFSRLSGFCHTDGGKEMANELLPVSNRELVVRLLDQTAELKQIRENGLYFPDIAFPSVKKELQLLSISNAVLEGKQIIKLKETAVVTHNLIRFLKEKKQLYPALFEIVSNLDVIEEMNKSIDTILEPNGFMRSSASKELGAIRKELSQARTRANKAFEGIVRKYKKLGWLREFDESYYNDRRVLAVIAEYKRQIEGLIHGISETGGTAFIEPASMVTINNEIIEAREKERREELKILTQLTAEIRKYLPQLRQFEYVLSFFDFTAAKARLAMELNANLPVLVQEKTIELVDARHPVLFLRNRDENKETVPLTITINNENRIIIISGPNAGGKSIAMKTVGLLQLMLQCGLLIPAKEHSKMSVFKHLFVDIGDDQSIESELSTYSSRLLKMKHFLFHANKDTLIFIDEFGTGSDPELGGAVAETILEELVRTKAYGMITTHYGNIKVLAEETHHLQNASMLFDEKTLEPKYRLQAGTPGSSYTFEVAKKIGLDAGIIDRAKEKLDSRKVKLDQLLITLQTKKNQMNRELHDLQEQRGKLKREVEYYQHQEARLNEQREKLSIEDNQRLIEKGKKYESLIDFWIKHKNRKELLKRIVIAGEKEIAREKQQDEATKIKKKKENILKNRLEKKAKQKSEEIKQEKPIEVGDTVQMKGSKMRGTVEDISKEKATVLFGMMRTIIPVSELKRAM